MPEPRFVAVAESGEIARALNNALAFLPAAAKPPILRVVFTFDAIEFTATDGYAIGKDTCAIESYTFKKSVQREEIWIERSAAVEIEKAARKDQIPKTRAPQDSDGKGRGEFAYYPGDSLRFTPQLEGVAVSAKDNVNPTAPIPSPMGMVSPEELSGACDDLLDKLEDTDPLMFDPALLGRFGKVKTPGKELAHMDLLPQPESNLSLVKIGGTFRGAIMGIDRPRAAENENMNQEGLW
ncbi:hypothetical protein [Streptomyces smyrnaeus]|uniref:hypothetical protein n=1 Tax=Streptomyces smyrnaeus TaxID=1387713 RepID=UPI0036A7A6DF